MSRVQNVNSLTVPDPYCRDCGTWHLRGSHTPRRTHLLILSSHGVLEYDDLRLFTRLGFDVFMPGGYADPRQGNDMRPGVPEAPYHQDLAQFTIDQREKHAGEPDGWPIIDWGKADLHPAIIDWADIIMVNCFPESWIGMQWDRIREKRVIWRTIGQSDPNKENLMRTYTAQGCQVVRYSPAEKRAFEKLGAFAGEDAMIRFAKDPQDYGPWDGSNIAVGNLAQHNKIAHERDAFINWQFVEQATQGLPTDFVGSNAETVGGRSLEYDELRDWLRHIRVMLYTGTQPASYTLGLMEAMLTGTPVVSIGPEHMWLPALFEGHELAGDTGWDIPGLTVGSVEWVHGVMQAMLDKPRLASATSKLMRRRGWELFGWDAVGPQWLDFLGAPVREMVAA